MNRLAVRQTFGLSVNINNCLAFSDDHQLVYVSGNQVVVLNTDTKEQGFIPLTVNNNNNNSNNSNGSTTTYLGVSTIACSTSKKLIAIAEQTDAYAMVTLYDSHTLKKKKVLHSPDLGSNSIVSMSFSDDGKNLLVQGAGPEWNMMLWNVEKAPKIINTVKSLTSDDSPIYQVSICPWDHTAMVAIGKNVFRVYRLVEGLLRYIPLSLRRDYIHITSHCWLLGDRLLLATDAGELILIENFEYRAVIYPVNGAPGSASGYNNAISSDATINPSITAAAASSSTTNNNNNAIINGMTSGMTSPTGTATIPTTTTILASLNSPIDSPISCLVPSSRGFIVGGKNGELKLFERKDDSKDYYVKEDVCYLPNQNCGRIVTMAISPDDTFVCATDSQQILAAVMNNLYNNKNDSTLSKEISIFEPILTSFHGPNPSTGEAAILGIDMALWKRVVVTCGKDCSVRIWNPIDHKIEFMKYFEEIPMSVSIHPSGLHMAIAFPDKVKLMSVLLDDFAVYAEISVRSCNFVKFSHGGQYIAAVIGPSIHIYDTFTATLLCTLRGHTNKIKSMVWMNYDNKIMSVGVDGIVHYWNLFNIISKRPEQYNHSVPFLCGSTMQDGSRAFVVTTEKILKEFSFTKSVDPVTGIEGKIREPRDVMINRMVNHVIVNETRNVVILTATEGHGMTYGTETITSQLGELICLDIHPQLSSNMDIYPVHASPITSICLSHDGNTLITGDANGCLVITDFVDDHVNHLVVQGNSASMASHHEQSNASNPNSNSNTNQGTITSFEFVDEVLIRKSDLDNRKQQVSQLSNRVNELNLNNDFQLRLKEMEYQETVKELSNKFRFQYQAENEKYELLAKEKRDSEQTLRNRLSKLMAKQEKETVDIEIKYKAKIDAETNRHRILTKEVEDMHKRWNEENKLLIESHQKYLKELTEEYEDKLRIEQVQQKKLLEDKESLLITYDDVKNKTEEDAEIEIEELKEKYDIRLKNEEESSKELKEQHTQLHKEIISLTKDSENFKDEIRKLKDKETRLLDNIKSLEKDIQSHKKEIREREDTITDKEKRMFELKKKNQELEKFRFVLDYKIKELKLQIAPREKEISVMQKQIEEMGLELEQYHKSNQALNLMIEDLKLKIDGLRKEYTSHEERSELSLRLLDKVKRDLQEVSLSLDDPRQLKLKMVKLYRIYLQDDMLASATSSDKSSGIHSTTSTNDKSKIPDPQEAYNRDREQMERSLDALRRAVKTDARARKRDFAKMIRDNVILTRELNDLRKEGSNLQNQKKLIDLAQKDNQLSNPNNITELLQLLGIKARHTRIPTANSVKSFDDDGMIIPSSGHHHHHHHPSHHHKKRSAALRTAAVHGKTSTLHGANTDHYEAWCVIQKQHTHIRELESEIRLLCMNNDKDPLDIFTKIDGMLDNQLSSHHAVDNPIHTAGQSIDIHPW